MRTRCFRPKDHRVSPKPIDRDDDKRVLVLAPTGRDGPAACALIEQAGVASQLCSGIDELLQALEAGAGAAIIAEEAFLATDRARLFEWVEKQPP